MPVFGTGNAAVGAPFAETEFEDWAGTITIAASGSLPQGSVGYRDVTQISGAPGQVGTSVQATLSDIIVLGNGTGVGAQSPIYGVYQGPTITNPSATATMTVTVLWRRKGYGVILATAKTAGTAVKVGDFLVGEPATDQFTLSAAFAAGKTAGTALATGAVTAYGATIIAVPGSGQTNTLINADIFCR